VEEQGVSPQFRVVDLSEWEGVGTPILSTDFKKKRGGSGRSGLLHEGSLSWSVSGSRREQKKVVC